MSIDGDSNSNFLDGTSGNDTINGFAGEDTLLGEDGDDTCNGGDDNDNIVGGNGFDTLFGGTGDDTLTGGGGDTVNLASDHPSDVIDGGDGIDLLAVNYEGFIIIGSGLPAAVTIDISTGTGEAVVSGLRGENFTHIERLEFDGPEGDDNVTGGRFDDIINVNGGNDIVDGGRGDDIVGDSSGFVHADGGLGHDQFILDRSADTAALVIDGEGGSLSIGGSAGGTFTGFESLILIGGSGNDTITGKIAGLNMLNGGLGKDTLTGGDLGDTLIGSLGNDTLDGGGGADTLNGGENNDTLFGGDGADFITTDTGKDIVHGDGGDDVVAVDLSASIAGSVLAGDGGHDALQLERDNHFAIDLSGVTITGFEDINSNGNFFSGPYVITMTTAQLKQFDSIHLFSVGENTTIKLADDGNIALPTLTFLRTLQLADGGQKLDMSAVGGARPNILGGSGNDVITGQNHAGTFGDATLNDGNDTYNGALDLDRVFGGNGRDNLYGGGSNDTLTGDAGNDVLKGGDGDDTLKGGAGADQMEGNAGLDKFVYGAVSESTGANFDTITGIDFRASDRIDLTFAVTGTGRAVHVGSLSTASFNNDLKAAIGHHELKAEHAILFTPDAGDFAGQTFLIVDANGRNGYQTNADLVIMLKDPLHLSPFDAADFI